MQLGNYTPVVDYQYSSNTVLIYILYINHCILTPVNHWNNVAIMQSM